MMTERNHPTEESGETQFIDGGSEDLGPLLGEYRVSRLVTWASVPLLLLSGGLCLLGVAAQMNLPACAEVN